MELLLGFLLVFTTGFIFGVVVKAIEEQRRSLDKIAMRGFYKRILKQKAWAVALIGKNIKTQTAMATLVIVNAKDEDTAKAKATIAAGMSSGNEYHYAIAASIDVEKVEAYCGDE